MMRILVLIISLLNLFCIKHYIREYKINSILKNKDLKIATLGFYPYRITKITRSSRTKETEVGLDFNNSLKKYFKIGKNITDFNSSGYNDKVSSDTIKKFITDNFSHHGSNFYLELNKIIEIPKNNTDPQVFKLKNLDIDYLVVGILTPEFERKTDLGYFTHLLTFLPCIFTLGTVPIYAIHRVEPEFIVFDKNLNEITRLKYENSYSTIQANWIPSIKTLERPDPSQDIITNISEVYIPEIQNANDDLTIFFNNR